MESRRQELVRALASAFLFFLVIGSYYVVKSVRDAVLVSKFEATTHPKIYIAVCLLTLPVGAGIASLAGRCPRQVLLPVVYVFGGLVFLGFWKSPTWLAGASESTQQAMRVAYFMWVSIFFLVSICVFWAFTHDLFTKEQGRRLYGIIGTGGILGGAIGGLLAKSYAKSLGSFGLVILSAVGLFISAVVAVLIHITSPRRPAAQAGSIQPSARLRDIPRILASPYVCVIAMVVVLHTLSETTVDLQVKAISTTIQMDPDAWTAYWGSYFWVMNSFAFVLQLAGVSLVHRLWGPRAGLLVLPAATLFLGPLLLWKPPDRLVDFPFLGRIPMQLAILAAVGIPLQAFAYTIWQSSKELLYVPTDASVKYQAKAFIDTFGFRFGDTIAAVLALVPLHGVAHVPWYATVGWVGCFVWMALAWRVGTAFEARSAFAGAPAAENPPRG